MVRLTAVVAALVTVLAGCADGESQPAAEPQQTATPSAAATSDEPLPCVPGTEPFAGAAADAFGAEAVMEAYCMLADLAEEQSGTSLALPVPEQTPRDVDSLRKVLTADASKPWATWMSTRATTDRSPIDGLTLHDVRRVPTGFERADDGPYVFGTRVGPATAELARGGRALSLDFQLDTGLVLEERGDASGRHLLLPVTRSATYVLVPADDGWLIDAWQAEFEHGDVQLVSG